MIKMICCDENTTVLYDLENVTMINKDACSSYDDDGDLYDNMFLIIVSHKNYRGGMGESSIILSYTDEGIRDTDYSILQGRISEAKKRYRYKENDGT
jgi:hypothetical protein